MFKKLHRKVLLLNMAVTLAVLLVAFFAVYLTTLNSINTENQRRLDNAAGAVMLGAHPIVVTQEIFTDYAGSFIEGVTVGPNGEVITAYSAPGMAQTIATDRVTGEVIPSFVVFVDPAGSIKRIDSPYDYSLEFYAMAAQTAWNAGTQSTMTHSGRTWLYKTMPFPTLPQFSSGEHMLANEAALNRIIFVDITDSLKTLQNLLTAFFFVGLGMLVVIFGVSYFFTRRAIQPVAVAWEKQRQFVADASHELKTPLATMMTNYDVLLANEESTVASQKEWLDYLRIGMDRMNRVTSNLLSLAKLESGELIGEKSPFDLRSSIVDCMQQMDSKAQEKDLSVVSDLADELPVESDKDLFEQVFSILYDNALKYADEGGTIEVLLRAEKKHAVCVVRNTGKGIRAEDLPHIFDRFYRADTARSSEDNSHGLGLPIALAIAEQLGGSITASSEEDGWTEFVLTLEI